MKNILFFIIFVFSNNIFAYQSIVPSSPQNIVGGDEVRARDGTVCRQGTHSGATLDMGVAAGQNQPEANSIEINNSNRGGFGQDMGAYARVVVPIGNQTMNRVDCTELYNLEIERLQIEIEQLKKSGSSSVQVE